MPINASPEYGQAEREFLNAYTTEEKIEKLKKMISVSPSHKGAENLRAQLRLKLSKLKSELETEKKKKKGKSAGIKKEGDAQVVIIGPTNSGKSALLAALTNAKPKISDVPFTTSRPEIGTLDLEGIKIQLVELPATLDKELLSIAKVSDLIIILVTSIKELAEMMGMLKDERVDTKKIVVLNKVENITPEGIKPFFKLPALRISAEKRVGLDDLRKKIFENVGLIRVFTKEPGKKPSERPMIVKKDATIKEMAEKIRKDFPERFIKARIWGASSKFPGQTVGIEHVLHDKDIIEMYLR